MNRRFRKLARLGLLSFILLSLCVRVLIPAGFMPSSLASGGPFVICPDGLFNFQAVVSQGLDKAGASADKHAHHGAHHGVEGTAASPGHDGHNGHDGHDGSDGDTSHTSYGVEFCPIGSVLGAAAASAIEPLLFIAFLQTRYQRAELPVTLFSLSLDLYRARGPPPAPLSLA